MPELFREMYYGPNVQNLVESDDCKVMRLSDNSVLSTSHLGR